MKAIGLFLIIVGGLMLMPDSAAGQGSKEVIVTNTSANAVPVRAVDDAARRAFQLGFDVNTGNTVTTPAGKIFVVEHVSGSFRLGTTSGATTPCRFLQIGLPISGITGPPEAVEIIPTVMGTTASVGNDVTFLSINHPMKFYVRQNTEIGGVNSVLGGNCTASPIMNSRIVLSGYLVDM